MLNKVVEFDPKNIPDYALDLLTNVNLMAGNHDKAKAQASKDVALAARPTLTTSDITAAMASRRSPAFDAYMVKKVVPALRLAGFPD